MMQPTAAGRAARDLTISLVLGVLLAACGGDSTDPPPAVATVEVSPPTTDRQVGQTIQLSATVKDASGNILSGQSVAWSSSAANVASVSSSGLVTASSIGTAIITAAAGSKSGVATINVVPEPIASITVAPTRDTVLLGETVQLTATLRDASNNVVTRPVTWQSSSPTTASVSNTGLVTGVGDGDVSITASAEGRSATAVITVLGPCRASLSPSIAVGQTIDGALASTDCQLPDFTYTDGYGITVTTATNVHIEMTALFDTFLYLVEFQPTGLFEHARNDDIDPDDPNNPNDPVDTNSRIAFTLQPNVQYFILANSFEENVFGDYQLKVTAVSSFVAGSSVVGKPGKAPAASLIKTFKPPK